MRLWVICVLSALVSAAALAQDAPLRARAAVDVERAFVGQTIQLQIQVEGSDAPEAPDMSALEKDFHIEAAGGGAQNSQSITIVNGSIQRVVKQGYTFNFQLIPKRDGVLQIPAIEIRADGRTAHTQPIRLSSEPPAEISDFKLRMTLSKARAYVGEALTLETAWYIGRNVDQFAFQMPLLEEPNFETADPQVNFDPSKSPDYLELRLGDGRVTARKGSGVLDGFDFVTVSFDKILIPTKPGRYDLPASTVGFRALKGVRRPRNLFDDFFGESMFGRRVYENLVIPSNRPTLEVLPLPAAGRPSDFSGLIGDFTVTASAAPTDVSVGDPITLTMHVSGPEYLDYVRLPELHKMARLASDFKIPEEIGPGEVRGSEKVFTQTLRARRAGVEEIPEIPLNFFNPATGRYEETRTKSIPLEVKATRMVTAADIEGLDQAGELQESPTDTEGGIGYNYEGPDALSNEALGLAGRLRSPVSILLLLGPPFGFLALLWRRRLAGVRSIKPHDQQAAELLSELRRAGGQGSDEVQSSLRRYLGLRLGLPAASLTFVDVAPELRRRGVSAEGLETFKRVFDSFEAGRYAGGAAAEMSPEEAARQAAEACASLEELC